jgi:hypothetical protein
METAPRALGLADVSSKDNVPNRPDFLAGIPSFCGILWGRLFGGIETDCGWPVMHLGDNAVEDPKIDSDATRVKPRDACRF